MSDIANWLSDIGLEKYVSAFEEAEIDFQTQPDLIEDDLKELGLPLGPRRKIWGAIKRLADNDQSSATAASVNIVEPDSKPDPASSYEAERRHLTVMFVDLVGSTEMATGVDPEDIRNVITGYQNTVAGVIARYEGFVAKFMGDGVLCYFGWPKANEDDAERAVRAGLDVINSVKRSCQRKLGCEGQGGDLASRHDQTQPISVFQDQSRHHPPCGDVVRPVPPVAPECGGFAA